MKFKNMKIEINESHPIDEVVMGLERLGYVCFAECTDAKYVVAHDDGFYQMIMFPIAMLATWPLTTLAELKAMTND